LIFSLKEYTSMEVTTAVEWAQEKNHGILITIRKDGRPQSSDISYAVMQGKFCISATKNRAKTKNLLRDARAVLHVTSPQTWSYVSFDGRVEVTEKAKEPNDLVCQELAAIYIAIQKKEHPDWEEFNEAMVKDQRLVIRFIPETSVGQVN
tara:strand:- start:8 stop:457 length:450 start_codon:yes stop_codon:yes gene_type:complete